MTTALRERPLSFFAETREALGPRGRRLTLEQRLQGAWEGLRADGATDCPVCHARMVNRAGSGACTSCGTQLT
jgi:ribosomal protein L37AE/L43A